jgi:hypothetical protein
MPIIPALKKLRQEDLKHSTQITIPFSLSLSLSFSFTELGFEFRASHYQSRCSSHTSFLL